MHEFELKFQVPRERVAAVEAALARGTVGRARLRARYFDTPGEALARRGWVLRVRDEGREHVQTAKGPGRGSFERLEHNVPLDGRRDAPDLALHDGHPAGKALRRALDGDSLALEPVFVTDVVRHSRLVRAAGTSVEIALDQGHVRANDASLPVLELEFELKEGSAAALVELAQRWCEEHGLWLDPLTKSAAGRRLAHDEQEPPPVMAREVQGAKGRSRLLASILDAGLQQALGNARELAAGTGGDEHIHELRVGLRRLRSALRELTDWSPLIAPVAAEIEPALREVFAQLGAHRDRSTLLPAWGDELLRAQAPLAGWDAPLPDVGAVVRAADFQQAMLRIVALGQELSAAEDGGVKSARRLAAARLQRLHRMTLRAGHDFAALPPPQRHRVRKRLKRLRYLAELVRPLFDGDAVDGYVAALKGLQDALGCYQDAAAGRQLFADHAAEDPRAWFGAGWLALREEELARDCEKACRKAARKALPFWQ
jgi:inorganic triphosphatase YgiF